MTQKRKGLAFLKHMIMLLVIAGAGVFVYMQLQKRSVIKQENLAVECQNQGEYRQAIEQYEVLLEKLRGQDADRIRTSIARCYVAMAENPELAFEQAMELYRKAHSYDPQAVTNPAILKRIDDAE